MQPLQYCGFLEPLILPIYKLNGSKSILFCSAFRPEAVTMPGLFQLLQRYSWNFCHFSMQKATYTHKCCLLISVWVGDGKRGKTKDQPQGFPEEIKTCFGDHSEASIGVVCSQFKFLLEAQKLHYNETKPLILSFIINLPYSAAGKTLHLGRMKYSLLDTKNSLYQEVAFS